jgi:hypothetical protein
MFDRMNLRRGCATADTARRYVVPNRRRGRAARDTVDGHPRPFFRRPSKRVARIGVAQGYVTEAAWFRRAGRIHGDGNGMQPFWRESGPMRCGRDCAAMHSVAAFAGMLQATNCVGLIYPRSQPEMRSWRLLNGNAAFAKSSKKEAGMICTSRYGASASQNSGHFPSRTSGGDIPLAQGG